MAQAQKITEEQANLALRELVATNAEQLDDEPEVVEAAPEPAPGPAEVKAQEPTPAAVVDEPETQTATIESAPEGDDVASLKKRLDEREQEVKVQAELNDKRWRALQERGAQNERILRERYLRKSTAAERALQALRQTRTEQGIPEAEVDRVIRELEGTMNPQSASYVPPTTGAYTPAPYAVAPPEDSTITVNSFLNEKGMTVEDGQEFGRWVTSEANKKLSPQDIALAERDLDGFLRLAHPAWLEDARERNQQRTKTEAVQAVQTVQRMQKEAAKAAAPATPAAPRKQPSAPKAEPDWKKMSKQERHDMVASLMRQSVEQYR